MGPCFGGRLLERMGVEEGLIEPSVAAGVLSTLKKRKFMDEDMGPGLQGLHSQPWPHPIKWLWGGSFTKWHGLIPAWQPHPKSHTAAQLFCVSSKPSGSPFMRAEHD